LFVSLFSAKKLTTKKLVVGEFKNHIISDSVVFRLPVLYNQRPPDQSVRDNSGAKTPKHTLTMLSHRMIWAFDNPEPNLLDSQILYHKISKEKNLKICYFNLSANSAIAIAYHDELFHFFIL